MIEGDHRWRRFLFSTMADDLSLLLKIRGDAAGGVKAAADTRAAISQLKNSASKDFSALQSAGKTALTDIGNNLNVLVGQRLPLIGPAFIKITDSLKGLGTTAAKTGEGLEAAGEGAAAAGGEIAAMAGPIGIAVVVVGALAVAGLALEKQLFSLAESAAEFRGKMFDLSQQTGVSVETLSALEIVAKTTGGSIESIAQSLVIFQGKLDEAQDASSKAGKQFAELGISVEDTEQSFREALIAIAKMPEGFQQTNTAAELFGRRGGKQVLAILKELHGDLDGAIARFKEMGIIISTEDAKAADEFNDQLALLNFQFRAMVGREAIPAVLAGMKSLSELLEKNQEGVRGLGIAVGGLALVFGTQLITSLGLVNSFFQSAVIVGQRLRTVYDGIAEALGLINSLSRAMAGVSGTTGAQGAAAGGGTLPTEHEISAQEAAIAKERANAAKKSLSERQKNAAAELDVLRIAAQDAQRIAEFDTEGLRQQFEQRKKTLEEYTNAVIELAGQQLAANQKVTAAEREQAQLLSARDRKVELARIALQEEKDQDAFVLATARANEARRKQEEASELALNKQLVAINDARREGELERNREAVERGALDRSLAIAEQIKIEQQAFDDRMALLTLEANQTRTTADRLIAIDNERLESQQRFTDQFKRLTQERLDAMLAESAKASELKLPEDFKPSGVIVPNIEDFGLPPEAPIISLADAFDRLGQSMAATFDVSKQNGQEFADLLSNAFNDLAQGIGQLIENWVLLGSTGPQAMRKLVASVLAGVAAQAAVKAIYELAEGFAALFWNPPAAAAHFTAAALFGSIAAGSAIAGRAIAGDAFQRPSRGGSGGGSGGGPSALQTIVTGRNQPQELHVRLHVDDTMFGRAVKMTVIRDYKDGGDLRELSLNDGI